MPNPIDEPKKKKDDQTKDQPDDSIVPSGGPAIAQAAQAEAMIAQDAANKKAAANPVSGSALSGQSSLPVVGEISPTAAAIMGLSGSDSPVPVGNTLETSGHVKPSSITPGIPDLTPTSSTPDVAVKKIPPIGSKSPDAKEIVKKILLEDATPPEKEGEGTTKKANASTDFGDYMKTAVGKIGDFLQRWGLNEMGAPGVQTRGEVQQAQQFELQKQQAQSEILARQQALENTYQIQRMQLQNQMNIANLPIEKKAELQNQIAILDAQYQQQLKLIPLEIQKMLAMRQWLPGAQPEAHILDQGK